MVQSKSVKNKVRYNILQKQILKHSKHLNVEDDIAKKNYVHNFSIGTDLKSECIFQKDNIIKKDFNLRNDKLNNEAIKTIRYQLFPTDKQIIVFQNWFSAYIEMYNLIIQKIRKAFLDKLSTNRNFKLIELKLDLDISDLKKEFHVDKVRLRDKYKISMHILDYAISDAITMHKSKISNLKNGHIKKSRLRYLKQSKSNKIFKVENNLCTIDSFCTSKLGPLIETLPKINFKKEIELVGIVQYNSKTNKYYMLVRKRVKCEQNNVSKYDKLMNSCRKIIMQSHANTLETSKDYISIVQKSTLESNFINQLTKELNLRNREKGKVFISQNEQNFRKMTTDIKDDVCFDPGINTFLTGISKNHIIEIGKNFKDKVKKELMFIDKINDNPMIEKLRKEKLLLRTREKLKNKVNDYHWKIINFLVTNYKHVLIGNFSTKEMVESTQQKMIKRIGSSMRFYVFKQRLQYKCYLNGIKYGEIDEYCTSKCCSVCGAFKKDLGMARIYKCKQCNLVIGRDINAAKNIYMRSIK